MPIKLFEAVAYRISVLGAPVRGARYLITEAQACLLLAKGKAERIAEAVMKTLVLSDGELARIAADAQAPVDARFSFHPSGERLKSIS